MNDILKREIASNFLENLLKGNRANCSSQVKQYLAINPSITDLYEEILKESLYQVGVLWETNKISVATEHLATAIVESILNELLEQLISKKRLNKKVVLSCVENEEHQVGIKMVADVFEMHGWDSFFLGKGIPVNELIRFIHEIKPDLLAISLSVYFNYNNLINMLRKLQVEFPTLQIIVGGQALYRSSLSRIAGMKKVVLLSDLYLLGKYINALNTKY
jgi:MerR family transcriptional regulator, light-induced transcriptional regulator